MPLLMKEKDNSHQLHNVFRPYSEVEWEAHALQLFRFQHEHNEVYRTFCNHLQIKVPEVNSLEEIPFLPISFFKTHCVVTTQFEPEYFFKSSGTTGTETSTHYIQSLQFYKQALTEAFSQFYGSPEEYAFLALLPNYLEQPHSSLIFMMDTFINATQHHGSRYFLYDHDALYAQLQQCKQEGKKTILFGVSFALLDFCEQYSMSFPELIIFETGGMKGRRKELVKEELHRIIGTSLGVDKIHSEYGMCELLSQAYSKGDNLFVTPPWMRLLLRDDKYPLYHSSKLMSGVINVVDFANIYSCAFIATEDIGRRRAEGIEILGRTDASEVRGCNLMYYK